MKMVKHSQSSQNSKFAVSLQYLRKEVKDEVNFLQADKHESLLNISFNILVIKVSYKVDVIIINGQAWLSIPKLLKVASLQYLYYMSKKKLRMEVIFDIQINVKVSTSWYYAFWKKWPDIFKTPKIGSS